MSDFSAQGSAPSMVTDGAQLPAVPSAQWTAAYAMGVVASQRYAEGVAELLDHVRGDASVLAEARDHLHAESVADAGLRRGAARLLEAAVEQARDLADEPDLVIRLDP